MTKQSAATRALVGGAMLALAGFFPWVSLPGKTYTGFDGHFASFVGLAMGSYAAVLGWQIQSHQAEKRIVAGLRSAGGFTLLFAAAGFFMPERVFNELLGFSELVDATPRFGLLWVAVAGAALFAASLHLESAAPSTATSDQGSRPSTASPPNMQSGAPSTAERTCPQCAETVKAAAKICRFCGFEFPLPINQPEPKLEAFEGEAVSNITKHAFGVEWGKTESGRIVFRVPGEPQWSAYQHGQTSLVPPSGL